MLAKYLFAGTISAVLAGGAVWMAADATEIAHPHETVEKRGKTADKRAPAPKAKDRDVRDNDASGSAATIDRMLAKPSASSKTRGSDASGKTSWMASANKADNDADTAEESMAMTKPAPKPKDRDADAPRKAWLDDYLKVKPDESEQDADDDTHGGDHHHMMSKEERDGSEDPMRTTRERVDTKIERGDGEATARIRIERRYSDVEEAKSDMEAMTDDLTVLKRMFGTGDERSLITSRKPAPDYDMLAKQAKKIDLVDARDTAYFDIVTAALDHGDFDEAEAMIGKLSTEELRDTARQNMGMALAKHGKLDAAFGVLDDLEIEELSDPIRAAIIRAATVGER